jgi:hypothetical protein
MEETSKNNETAQLGISDVIQRYFLIQLRSCFTGELFETWYRPDMMLFIERWVLEEGKVVDKFRILPNTNDVSKIGHIDFTKHYYDNFEEAVKAMISLNIV